MNEARPADAPAPVPLPPSAPGPLWQRLAWFVALWAAGVAAVAAVAYVLRWWLTGAIGG